MKILLNAWEAIWWNRYFFGARAIAGWVLKGCPRVPLEEEEARESFCDTCPLVSKGIIDVCGSCGCILTIKRKMADQECPEGFWGEYAESDSDRAQEAS